MPQADELIGEWVHAHEEDHDGLAVFRRAGHPLPPARGRRRLVFLPDGAFVEKAIGRADGSEPRPGRWEATAGRGVVARTDATGATWHVERVAGDTLEIRPEGPP
ncbi:hypothetical protein GCM10009809_41830 [Isoptericola hypogeus]|uniref:Uncharacterized protein n=1 Tax=Isoptericola hypogeus TaxID=300179 RepID=A0ABN2JX31_9MICO